MVYWFEKKRHQHQHLGPNMLFVLLDMGYELQGHTIMQNSTPKEMIDRCN
jgi:hypothetical protein